MSTTSRYVAVLTIEKDGNSYILWNSTRLLRLALPLVKTHGFTREALARSVLALPPTEAHSSPLSDSAVSALFGDGDVARKTLINAWLRDGLMHMGHVPGVARPASVGAPHLEAAGTERKAGLKDVLRARLEYNEPVLAHLPEVSNHMFTSRTLLTVLQAFALLASPSSGLPPLDPLPAFKHASQVAQEACYVTGDSSLQVCVALLFRSFIH